MEHSFATKVVVVLLIVVGGKREEKDRVKNKTRREYDSSAISQKQYHGNYGVGVGSCGEFLTAESQTPEASKTSLS
jgi:hypothetical protein